MLQLFLKLQVSSFTTSKYMKAVPKFKNSVLDPRPWPRNFYGYFVMHEMGLAKVYQYTKFEVSSFNRSKDTAHFWRISMQ